MMQAYIWKFHHFRFNGQALIITSNQRLNYNVQAKSLVLSGLHIETYRLPVPDQLLLDPHTPQHGLTVRVHVVKLPTRIAHLRGSDTPVASRIGIPCITLWHP